MRELTPQADHAIKEAAKLCNAEDHMTLLLFIYWLGFSDGLIEIAKVGLMGEKAQKEFAKASA